LYANRFRGYVFFIYHLKHHQFPSVLSIFLIPRDIKAALLIKFWHSKNILVYGVCMEGIHSFDEDAYYYCSNKECVCNQRDQEELAPNTETVISLKP